MQQRQGPRRGAGGFDPVRAARAGALWAVILAVASPGGTTWSINLADRTTGEVAVGTATCVNGIDLQNLASVVVVRRGTGSSQSFVDSDGLRRAEIHDGLMAGTAPADILLALQPLPGHETRQYGIADTEGRTVTFSGSGNFAFAGGVTGVSGSLAYAIQGNIITGMPVVDAAEQAVISTAGDVPAKLMAAMQAARAKGGDGRCSCPGPDPTACGSPPAAFTHSAINGGMIVARRGDADDPLCDAAGCVDGDYYMRLTVAGQSFPDPDPVDGLQTLFDAFRESHKGRPDAIRSQAAFEPSAMIVTLLDWRGLPATVPGIALAAEHAPGSAGRAAIGAVQDLGGGVFRVALAPASEAGTDRFVVSADDGVRPVILMPDPAVDWDPGAAGPTWQVWLLLAALVLLVAVWLYLRR